MYKITERQNSSGTYYEKQDYSTKNELIRIHKNKSIHKQD